MITRAQITKQADKEQLTNDVPAKISYIGPLRHRRTVKLYLAPDELVVNTEMQSLLTH